MLLPFSIAQLVYFLVSCNSFFKKGKTYTLGNNKYYYFKNLITNIEVLYYVNFEIESGLHGKYKKEY
jgi:hypothetical protein